MMMKLKLASAIAVLCFASPAQAGTKDDIRDLQARLLLAEQGLSASAEQTVRINQLESEIQSLTGRIEQLNYELSQANARLDSVSAVLAGGEPAGTALDTLGGVAEGTSDVLPTTGGPVDLATGDPIADQIVDNTQDPTSPSDVTLPLDPTAAFDYSSRYLLQGDYPRAKAAFALYVEAFPSHPRTPDAQFRLGEVHLALGENAAAADVFIQHIRNYPSDIRAAEAYLKLGTAFSRLEKAAEACTVFKTLKSKFPSAESAIQQRADIEMARIDCQ